jgi:hypothetical protein
LGREELDITFTARAVKSKEGGNMILTPDATFSEVVTALELCHRWLKARKHHSINAEMALEPLAQTLDQLDNVPPQLREAMSKDKNRLQAPARVTL